MRDLAKRREGPGQDKMGLRRGWSLTAGKNFSVTQRVQNENETILPAQTVFYVYENKKKKINGSLLEY